MQEIPVSLYEKPDFNQNKGIVNEFFDIEKIWLVKEYKFIKNRVWETNILAYGIVLQKDKFET